MQDPVISMDPDHEHFFFSSRKRTIFLLLCLSTLAVLFIKKSFIENGTAAFEFLSDQPEGSWLAARSTLQYFSIPFIYAWKFTALSYVVWLACLLFGYRITYAQCWGIVMAAEFVFLVPELIKIVWFMIIYRDPTFYEIQSFYPLSVMNFFDYQELSARFAYPFKALNLFEPVYWLLLAVGINHYSKRGMKTAWIIVLVFYVPVFLLWLAFYATVYG